ncbi:MAG: hypothetical protein CMK32_09890 [Porticoccaceae bacterium]|nr:hypothetical protein [Porticoccaceae bacterium]
MALIDLIKHARSGNGLIATAAPYLKEMQACLKGEGACPAKLFGLDSADAWKKALEEADEKLTYCDPNGGIKSVKSEKAELSEGSILDYDAILSTSQKDRDGDILRTEGMQLEPGMPLLWQHMWNQPIGKMLSIVEQNDRHVVCKYAVADTEMGRDAAKLIRMGALRKSHGFMPIPGYFEMIDVEKSADGSMTPAGYDIKRCSVYESSVVSIPANAGTRILRTYEKEASAIFTAVEQKQLESEVFSRWAKGLYDNRQRFFPGADFGRLEKMMTEMKKTVEDMVTAKTPGQKDMQSDSRPKCSECEDGYCDESGTCDHCGHVMPKSGKSAGQPAFIKSFDESVAMTKSYGMPDSLPGSFESVQRALSRKAEDYLEDNGVDVGDYEYVTLIATFSDSAIVCKRNYRKDSEYCYRLMWEMTEGKPAFTGQPEKVEIEATVVSKALDASGARIKEMGADAYAKKLVSSAFADGELSDETKKSINTLAALINQPEEQTNPLTALFGG